MNHTLQLFLLLSALAAAQGSCPNGFVAVGNQCYLFSVEIGDKSSWDLARDACHLWDADLAVLDMDCNDNHHLITYIINKGWTSQLMWVGASDKAQEGMWMWIDGRPLDMTSNLWRAGEPTLGSSYDCAHLGYYNYDYPRIHLYDNSCSKDLYYICHYGAHARV
ncbi:C-type lectin domain family 17, member A-like [Panulirus ornatus]|uniref:C-type lectin domain family 17, member A-like n=1 Tax=Panulirus ornatus TaxID=150431 RepID=UPI003A878AE8